MKPIYRFQEVGLAVILFTGVGAFGSLIRPPGVYGPAERPSISRNSTSMWASIGGLAETAAGLQWVRVYRAWRQKDPAALERRLNWVVTVDPEPLTYWLNGARMLTFDVADWHRQKTPADSDRVRQRQLEAGLAWLDRARMVHPHRSLIPIEEAVLHWSVNRDLVAVEQALARAQALPDAPPFVGRLRAEMLRRQGKPGAALDLLREIDANVPQGQTASAIDETILQMRIQELERTLPEQDDPVAGSGGQR